MAEERASVSIRIPRSLLEKLKEAANARSHSMNAEIVQRLSLSVQVPAPIPVDPQNSDIHFLRLLDQDGRDLARAWEKLSDEDKLIARRIIYRLALATKGQDGFQIDPLP